MPGPELILIVGDEVSGADRVWDKPGLSREGEVDEERGWRTVEGGGCGRGKRRGEKWMLTGLKTHKEREIKDRKRAGKREGLRL